MNETRIHDVRVRFRGTLSANVRENLTRTLDVVPVEHHAILTQIDVVPPANLGHGPEYAGGGSGIGWPRLSELCFDRRYRPNNTPLNLTLLHEIGHIVQSHYHCLENMAADQRRVVDAVPIPRRAHTHGPEEHYAIAYQRVLCGTAGAAVTEAVYSSRAFEGISRTPGAGGTPTDAPAASQ